jgi:hypothetical protein
MLNIGIDFHDTISYNPGFFKSMMRSWDGAVFIVTGTPQSQKIKTIEQLNELGISPNLYQDILMGYEYKKEDMTIEHFHKMKQHKLNHLIDNNISVYFDDNPFYIDFLRNNGILTFQTVLNDQYLDEFENKHNFFTCNLQRNQFDYLKSL